MKRILSIILFFFCFEVSNTLAQYVLLGTTSGGGANNDGTIFMFNPLTGKDSVLFSFNGTNGNNPIGNFFLASNNLLYSTTAYGGAYNLGTMYSYNCKTNQEKVEISFNGINGAETDGCNDLIIANNSLIYGTTWSGGTHNSGVVYSYNINTSKDSVLFSFDTTISGCHPFRGLFLDTLSGLLYGRTKYGGKKWSGVLFSFNPLTNRDSTLYDFDTDTAKGVNPVSNFIKYNGLLYGITYAYGSGGAGTIFTYNIVTNSVNSVFGFNNTDGGYSDGDNMVLINGIMYGLTAGGGNSSDGAFFSFDPVKDSERVLVNFNGLNGVDPEGRVIQDPDNGLLYGVTMYGGSSGEGVLFSYDINTSTYKKLLDFNGTNGAYPACGFTLIKDSLIETNVNVIKSSGIIKAYPNPNNGSFTLTVSNLDKPALVEVYNMMGEELYKGTLNSSTTLINIGEHSGGVYLYRVIANNGQFIGEGKIMVAK